MDICKQLYDSNYDTNLLNNYNENIKKTFKFVAELGLSNKFKNNPNVNIPLLNTYEKAKLLFHTYSNFVKKVL